MTKHASDRQYSATRDFAAYIGGAFQPPGHNRHRVDACTEELTAAEHRHRAHLHQTLRTALAY